MENPVKSDNKPLLLVYEVSGDVSLSKAIWSMASSHDINFKSVNSVESLYEFAPKASLIVFTIGTAGDDICKLVGELGQKPDVTADLMGFSPNATIEQRIAFLTYGFDYVFNNEFIKIPDFRQVLLKKMEKGRRRLETRVQQEEYKRFRASLSASPDAFIVFDENNKIFFVSHHYARAYPRSAHKLTRGMDVMEAFDMLSQDQGLTTSDPRYTRARKFWERLQGVEEFDMGDGRFWRMKAAKLDEGQGTIVTTTDISLYTKQKTDLEEAKLELEKTLATEQEASALQKQFVNMVSHEFRTPLTIIDGHAQILSRKAEEISAEDIRKRSKTIRSAVSRLISMMEGVLSSNMLKTGKLEIIPEPLDIRQFAHDLCEDHAELAKDHDIHLVCENVNTSVNVDKKIVSLILTNLLSNAIKYTKDDPQIHVFIGLKDKWLNIRVKDNGIGIPYEEIPRIFERYFRASTASGIPGTGIGLSLVKDLVELYQGRLEVNSDAGKGTEFSVSLPIKQG